jgi:Xaa-Pro aminopeptidase
MNVINPRLEKVRKVIKESHCDAFLIEDPINLFYLTGCHLSAGTLLIQESDAVLLVDSRYFEFCKNKAPMKVLLSEKNPLETILKNVANLAFDSAATTYQEFLNLQKKLKDISLIPLNNPIQQIRAIKDRQEITLLKEAASLGSEGFHYVKSLLKEGIKESDLAVELEIFWKRKGGQGLAFDPIIAFGENSAMPHYRAAETELKDGMTVLIDIGVKWKGYHSDMTRTLFWGGPTTQMREIYAIVEEAQKRALAVCKPGTTVGDLDAAARDYITSKGYGEHFLHSLGHGVGLEIHEWPLIRKREPYQNLPLEEGMVITIEPGIYLPGIGGVRIEDTVAITSSGYELLTH